MSRSFDALSGAVTDFAGNPRAGWRKATDAIEEVGAAKDAVPNAFDLSGKVISVADGDTVTILDRDKKRYKIRLYGIDAPEREQPFFKASKTALSRKISGRTVGITVVEKDQYGRTVGKIYLDGVHINLEMVREGHCWWYQRYAKYERSLQAAQTQAMSKKIGLWADLNPTPPWEWRRR